ncbi:MAG: PAS domain S-box protein [Bacteroidota bacterium]|nr:PAS domain S-box protein [Bacteroidota bacterium]
MQLIDKRTQPDTLFRKDYFNLLFDSLDDGFILCNQYAIITYANRMALKLLGKSQSSIQFESLSLLLPLFDFEAFEDFIANKAKKEYSFVHNPIVSNGKAYALEFTVKKTGSAYNSPGIAIFIKKLYNSTSSDILVNANNFEKIIVKISGMLAVSNFNNVNGVINQCLQLLGKHTQTDRCHLYLLSESKKDLAMTHEWVDEGFTEILANSNPINIEKVSTFWSEIMHKMPLIVKDRDELPKLAMIDEIVQLGIETKSFVCIPIFIRDELSGLISCSSKTHRQEWYESILSILKVAGEIIVSTFQREMHNKAIKDKDIQLHSAFDNAVLGLYRTTPAGKVLMANKAILNMMGYNSNYDLTSINVNDSHFIGSSRQQFKTKMNRHGEVKQLKSIWKRKNGEPLYVLENAKAIKDENGIIIYYEGTIEDITDKTQYEEESIRLTQLIRQAAVSIIITDINGIIKYANPFTEKTTGYSFSEIEGKTPAVLSSGIHDKSYYSDLWQTILSGKVWNGEFSNRKKNGDIYEESAVIFPIYNKEGKLINFAAVKQDISEQNRTRKTRDLLYRISNAVNETYDLNDFYIQIRKELSEVLNTKNFYIAIYDNESKTFKLPYFIDDKDGIKHIPAGKSLSHYVLKHDKAIIVNEKKIDELISKNEIEVIGTKAKVWLGVPLRSKGKPIGVIGLQCFKSEKAFSEKDLKLLEFVSDQIKLSIERKESEINLIEAKKKAEQSDKLKSAFLANMSHEIRTPMNAIIGFSGLLASNGLNSEDKNNYKKQIQENGNALLNLIEDIIDISKIEAGETSINKTVFNIANTLNELLKVHDVLKQKSGKFNIDILLKIPTNHKSYNIFSDQRRFRQIFSNLLSNAIKYTHHGHIEFGFEEQKGNIRFFVSDTGIGIPANKISYIFDSFSKFSETKTKIYGGTGIGLAISKNLVNTLDGEIWADSKEDHGSTFYFTLPFENKEKAENSFDKISVNNNSMQWQGKKILIAEDVESNYNYLKSLLEPSGALFIWARDGKEAVDFITENHNIDIVLMDIRMPVMNGFEATRRLREQKCNIPIIAQTAHALESDKRESEEAGCQDYISKPINPIKLIQKINRQFAKKTIAQ